ncbi:MAG: carboxypeptidase regulatory-like domain-containing protein [Acidobacteria bacterium]|nr:carboxypeptidase regulatory-like domain-containing protein [Acidobacteriota bacterium]MBV9187963.1 carboxypeptidase regulatory-like domain-containing protein [Acidobacteriota bacterium]
MKRALLTLSVVLMVFPSFAAPKKHSAKATSKGEIVATKKTEHAAVTSPLVKGRKQLGGEDPGATKNAGPVAVGGPVEQRLTKATGKKFDLRNLPFVPSVKRERPEREAPRVTRGSVTKLGNLPPVGAAPLPPVRSAPAPAPLTTFAGLDDANWGAGHPPDTNGDAGPVYYIQTINTSIGVYRKSDGVRVAAFTFDTFMSQGNFGNLCDTDNFGDPVVLYDSFEDRWIISDFAFQLDGSGNVINPPGSFQCFAVSMNGDPVSGGWNYYSINTTGGLGDYPKMGIWPDGLYMSVNMFAYAGSFQNTRLYAFNKAQMYAGSPTVKVVSFNLPSDQFTVIPANARLQTGTPPPGRPNLFASVWNFLDAIQIWKFHVDWANPGLSTITGTFDSTMTFWWEQYDRGGGVETAPSPANSLDTLYPRLMVQNQYSNIGGVESLWDSHTVGAGNPVSNVTSAQSAVRYYQVNVTGGNVAANTVQSFTYSPDATVFRYMPSAAVNRNGDLAIGYTTSNATTNPTLSYAGRLAGDPVNSITLTEQLMFAGSGSQSGSCGGTCERWGDYSAMTLDPDGCKFWYTNEYYLTTGLNHQTRIGSFVFPGCTPVGAGGTVTGTVTATVGGLPISGATVNLGSRTTTTNSSGVYTFTGIPAGTYPYITASAPGFIPSTVNSIVVTDGGTTTQNFSLASASSGSCFTDTTQADFQGGTLTNVDVTTSPGDVKLTNANFIDQQNESLSNSGNSLSTASWRGQLFKAGSSGQLVAIDVNLFALLNAGSTTPNFTVSIRATAAGVPTGADLVSTTMAGFDDGGFGGYHTAVFGSPLAITAGTTYAFIIRPVANPSSPAASPGYFFTVSPTATDYPFGTAVRSTNGGSTWTISAFSGGFHTYVNNGFAPTGNLISSMKDANPAIGNAPTWTTLSWTATTPPATSLQFQVAASNSANGPFNFVGPDGTAATFFTTSGASLSQFNGFRYLEYKAILNSSNSAVTPTLSDVTVCFADVACGSGAPGITPTPASVCPGSVGNTAAGPAGMVNYSWAITNGTITGGLNAQTVTYTAGASGTVGLMLTVTDGTGCLKSNTTSVTINAVPATPTITPTPAAVCANATGNSAAGPAGATSYAWSITNGTITSATNIQTITYTAGASGTVGLTLVVTNAGGCSATNTANVTINANPASPTITPTPASVCANSTGNSAAGPAGATSYAWSITNGTITSATNIQTITYTAGASGTVGLTLVVTNAGGCSASNTANVTINAAPTTPTITPTPASVCANSTGNSAAGPAGATSYAWSITNGTITSATTIQTITYTAGASGTVGLTLVVTNASGCSASNTSNVTINANPVTPTITPTPASVCANSTGNSAAGPAGATSYAWSITNGTITSATNIQTITYTAGASGTVGLTLVVTNASGCSASNTSNVTINAAPATPTITPTPASVCANSTGNSAAGPAGATSYAWSITNGTITSATNIQTITYTAGASGTVGLTLVVTNASGCSASNTANVTINANPATPTITPTPASVCANSTGNSAAGPAGATSYAWSITNGTITSATNIQTITYTAGASGTVGLTLVVTNASGCSATNTSNVTINANPASPTITPTPASVCANSTGNSAAGPAGATSYAWSITNGTITSATNIQTITYTAGASGTVGLTLVVTNASGCSATNTSNVTINANPAAPAITPTPAAVCASSTGNSASGPAGATSYAWSITNGTITSAANIQTITYTAGASGTVGLTLVVTNASGCSATNTANVTINPNPNATITAPVSVPSGSTGNIASVANAGGGATYAWSISGGTITGGTGTNSITFTAGAAGTLTLNVTVTTGAGCSDAKSANVTVTPVSSVTVTSVSPVGGTTAGGSAVTINGTGFNAGATVTFGGSAATNVVVVSSTKITARTPAHAAGSVNVTVTNTDTSTGTLTNGYLYKPQQFDPNNDGTISPMDIFYLVNYLYLGGPPPMGAAGMLSGDANGDGVVNPLDIFYLVNYLFLGGPRPNSIIDAPHVTATSVGTDAPQLSGSIALGKAVLRNGHYVVPVIMTAGQGSVAPQAMSLRVHFDGEVGNATIRKAGAAKDLAVAFETDRLAGNDLSYLVSYGNLFLGSSASAVVAEIEIEAGNVTLSVDPQLTMLSNQAGTMTASVSNGKLQVTGTKIGNGSAPQPRTPELKVN